MQPLHAITVRQAEAADVDAVARVTNAAFLVERFFTPEARTSPDRLRMLMSKGAILVAEDAGELLGSVYVERRGDRLYIGLLAVDPVRQGQGLGRVLMDAAENYGRARRCAAADITVVNLRKELPPFYRRLGYVEQGLLPFDRDEAVNQPCHFILMSKAL